MSRDHPQPCLEALEAEPCKTCHVGVGGHRPRRTKQDRTSICRMRQSWTMRSLIPRNLFSGKYALSKTKFRFALVNSKFRVVVVVGLNWTLLDLPEVPMTEKILVMRRPLSVPPDTIVL